MSDLDKTVEGENKQLMTDKPEGTPEPTLKELQDQFVKIQSDFQAKELEYRKQISGLDRKVSESEKLIQQKELDKLQGIEREKAEAELIRAENAKIRQENAENKKKRIIDSELFNSGIPSEFAKRINGQSAEEIQADVKEFKSYVEKLATERAEKIINEKLGGKPPVTGTAPGTKVITEAQFKAMNPRDHAAFFASGGKIEG